MTALVMSAAFSPDGTRIVTASDDKTARIRDAGTAKEIAVLRGHDDPLVSAAFSPDGSRRYSVLARRSREETDRAAMNAGHRQGC
jgi:WD40 repeat protein